MKVEDLKTMSHFISGTVFDKLPISPSCKLEGHSNNRAKVAAQALVFSLARLQAEKEAIEKDSNPFDSPKKLKVDSSLSQNAPGIQKPVCQFGAACYRKNLQHKQDYYHPPPTNKTTSPSNDNNNVTSKPSPQSVADNAFLAHKASAKKADGKAFGYKQSKGAWSNQTILLDDWISPNWAVDGSNDPKWGGQPGSEKWW